MTYINGVSASFAQHQLSTSNVELRSDVKAGIIKLNGVLIKINAGDNLQRICNKINAKKSSHGVTARIEIVHGKKVISLSSSRQIDILDRNNVLNNIGVRLRSNLPNNSLVTGLVLTSLAEDKKSLPRCRFPHNYPVQQAAPVNVAPLPAYDPLEDGLAEVEVAQVQVVQQPVLLAQQANPDALIREADIFGGMNAEEAQKAGLLF